MKQPFVSFLPGRKGRLLLTGFPPAGHAGSADTRWLIFVPPFAEEMNKSRRCMSLLGRALSEQGIGLLIFDLFGTGDSEGDFAQADWPTWLADLETVRQWLNEEYSAAHIDLIALRGGALLAWDYLARNAAPVETLVLWQPALSGKQWLTQFLRLRTAASMMGQRARESTAELKQQLAATGILEVAGYTLSAALANGLEAVQLGSCADRSVQAIKWFEVVAPEQAASPATQRLIAQWRDEGVPVTLTPVIDDAFWLTQEIAEGRGLIEATVSQLG